MKIVYPVAPIKSGGIKDAAGEVHHLQTLVDSANAMSSTIERLEAEIEHLKPRAKAEIERERLHQAYLEAGL